MIGTLADYKPGKNALAMHRSDAREVLVVAPIRSGKTYSARRDIVKNAWNNPYPDYATLITAPEYKQLGPLLEDPITDLLDRMRLLDWHNFSDHESRLKNGRKLFYRSCDNYEAIRGLDVWLAYIDEMTLVKREAKEVIEGRLLLTNGQLKAFMTPKGTGNWVYEDYYGPDAKQHKLTQHLRYTIFDNPVITKEAVERLAASYDPLMYRQEILAEWVNLTADRVYYAFSEELNVKALPVVDYEPIYIGLDYNLGKNGWIALQRDLKRDRLIVFCEGYGAKTTRDAALQIKERFSNDLHRLYILDDASGNIRQQGDGKTQREILQQNGLGRIASYRANPERPRRYAVVNAHFENGLGVRHLFVAPECKRLIHELNHLCYKPDSDIPDDRGGAMGHITDALGYAVWYVSGGQAAWDISAKAA